MNIEELAVKCGAQKRWGQTAISADVIIFTAEQLQAFADEWLALNSSEPVAWLRYIDGKIDWAEDCLGSFAGDVTDSYDDESYTECALYKANPINQELLESHKRLQEALKMVIKHHTEPAGMTAEIASHKEKLTEFLTRCDTSEESMLSKVNEALQQH